MAEQTIPLVATDFFDGATNVGWQPQADGNRILVDGDLLPPNVNLRRFERAAVSNDGRLRIAFARTATEFGVVAGDLSDEFENSGSVSITAAGMTATWSMAGADIQEPYSVPGGNSEDWSALYAALNGLGNNSTAGTLTLRDFVPVAPNFADDTGDAITGTVGTAIAAVTVPEATGIPAPTYAVVGDLPAGAAFDPDSRELTFTTADIVAGSGTIRIRATNSEGDDDLDGQLRLRGGRSPAHTGGPGRRWAARRLQGSDRGRRTAGRLGHRTPYRLWHLGRWRVRPWLGRHHRDLAALPRRLVRQRWWRHPHHDQR